MAPFDGVGLPEGKSWVPVQEGLHEPPCGQVVPKPHNSSLLVEVGLHKLAQVLLGEREAPVCRYLHKGNKFY